MLLVLLLSLLIAGSMVAGSSNGSVAMLHMHGVMEGYVEDAQLKTYFEANLGIDVHLIDAFNYKASLTPIATQIPVVSQMVQSIAENYDYVILSGFSQGGVIMRGVLESWSDHNVIMFLSIASPQHGCYGLPRAFPDFDKYDKREVYKILYTDAVQSNISLSNFYLDPTHYEMYLDSVDYFPLMNNEREGEEGAEQRKENFSSLRKLLLVGGPDDGVVIPWQSSQFGYYTEQGYDGDVVPMEQTRFYQEDLFGLRTLAESGRVERCTYIGIVHRQFRDSTDMYKTCIQPTIAEMLAQL